MPDIRCKCSICGAEFIGASNICDFCFLLKCYMINKIDRAVKILESLGYTVTKVVAEVDENQKEGDL